MDRDPSDEPGGATDCAVSPAGTEALSSASTTESVPPPPPPPPPSLAASRIAAIATTTTTSASATVVTTFSVSRFASWAAAGIGSTVVWPRTVGAATARFTEPNSATVRCDATG